MICEDADASEDFISDGGELVNGRMFCLRGEQPDGNCLFPEPSTGSLAVIFEPECAER